MRTTSLHQSLADRIKADIIQAQRVSREDPGMATAIVESQLRAAWNGLQERIISLHLHKVAGPPINHELARLVGIRTRYSKPKRRWSLARLLGLI